MTNKPIAIVGAGPAGLSAAYELIKRGMRPIVFETASLVGGIARTESYKGYYFDIGGHRFYTKIQEVNELWRQILGTEFIKVPRISHIYYQGHFFSYPIRLFDTLSGLGVYRSLCALVSFLIAKSCPYKEEKTMDEWLSNRFGRYLYKTFFESYTEKVWGLSCKEMPIHWAVQRIRGLSFFSALSNAFSANRNVKTLIPEFYYPPKGPGMMWHRLYESIIGGGGQVRMNCEVIAYCSESSTVKYLKYREGGRTVELPVSHVISSAPVTQVLAQLDPNAPDQVMNAAGKLFYRALILVVLIVDRRDVFPGQWIYVHEPDVKVGRIQNFKNWSQEMVPDSSKTSLGMEFFCSEGDYLWALTDHEIVDLASGELSELGFGTMTDIIDSKVIRQPKAYPVYDLYYEKNLRLIRGFLRKFNNLQLVGRNGMHRYNNMDHSVYTGILAARNILNGNYDLWSISDEDYFEEERVSSK